MFTQTAQSLFKKKINSLGIAVFVGAAMLSGCATDEKFDTGLPDHSDWKPILQTQQAPVATYYVNTKITQKDAQNIYKGLALMQPIWHTKNNPDGSAGQTEKTNFSLVWQFTLNCDNKKLESQNYAVVKGLFAEGEAASVNTENPFTEESDFGKKLIKFYCKK